MKKESYASGFKFKNNKFSLKKILLNYNTIIMLILLIFVSSLISDKFFSWINITNILNQQAGLAVVSMGMLLVILTGGIDLSVGSIVAFSGIMASVFLADLNFAIIPAIFLTIFLGVLIGSITGMLVSYAQMAPFIASLAMMTITRGLAYIFSNGHPIQTPLGTLDLIGDGYIFGVPNLIVIAIFITIVIVIILRYTAFGRIVIATGSNENAVRLAGIREKAYKLSVYLLSGALSAIGGIIIASRTGIGSPIVGMGMELDAIAAVVIGGASLMGGRGSAARAAVGVIILGLISNIMTLLGIPAYPQDVVKGLIIIGAVILQGLTSKKE